jgi:hypothetical protein
MRLPLLLVVVASFKIVPFRVCATGLGFLPLIEVLVARTLESRVVWSAIVPEFQGYPGKDVLGAAAILFSEIRIIIY